jgi:hypothetical protein
MKPPTKFETAYKELTRIGSGTMNDEAIAEIRRAMNSLVSLLVARAAQIAGKRELHDLIPDSLSWGRGPG